MAANPSGSNRRPLVSVTIPCYRQLHHARSSVGTVLAQSLGDFEVTLLDDGGSDEYRRYVESLGDPRIRYRRNATRLGAMKNMFQAIGTGNGAYSLAFHEDDLLGAHYLSAAVDILEQHPRCGFVAADLREFHTEPTAADLTRLTDSPARDLFATGADFLRAIFRGLNPMFGSVVYRRSAIRGVQPAHEEFGTLVDRPFLLAILQNWSGAVIRDPLVWYRRHGDGDVRHHGMSANNILHLLNTYRSALPTPLSADDAALFHSYTAYWLMKLYTLLPDDKRPSLGGFLFRAWREGLYDPRRQRGYGRKAILRAVLSGRRLSFP